MMYEHYRYGLNEIKFTHNVQVTTKPPRNTSAAKLSVVNRSNGNDNSMSTDPENRNLYVRYAVSGITPSQANATSV